MLPRGTVPDGIDAMKPGDHMNVHVRLGVTQDGVVDPIRANGLPDCATDSGRLLHQSCHGSRLEVLKMCSMDSEHA